MQLTSICIFCGSSDQVAPLYIQSARHLGQTLAARGLQLIFGGGKTGLMGAVADGVLEGGGQVIGVITEDMNTPALAHNGLTRLEVLPTILMRKQRMMDLADAFIALPGGYGTLDELFDALTGLQIGDHQKPVGLLNINRYYNPLLAALDTFSAQGFIMPPHRKMLLVHEQADALLEALSAFDYPADSVRAWLRED